MDDAHVPFLRSLADLAAYRFDEHKSSAEYFEGVARKVEEGKLDPVVARLVELAQAHRLQQGIWSLVRGQVLNQLARTGTPYVPQPNENLLYFEEETS